MKIKNWNLKILIAAAFCFLFSAFYANAALVPCGPGNGRSCQFCDLATLIERIINFGIYNIAIPLSVIFIVYGGFVIMTAGDSSERVKNGKDIIKAAIIGFIIVLCSWLIVNAVLSVLTGQSFEPWSFGYQIKDFCKVR